MKFHDYNGEYKCGMAVVLLILEPFYLKLSLRETPKTQCTYARVAKIKSFSTASPNVYVIYVVCFVYICLVWCTTCTFHVYVVYVVYKCLCLCCRCAKPDIEANCSCGVYVLDKDQNRLRCDCSLVPAKPGTWLLLVACTRLYNPLCPLVGRSVGHILFSLWFYFFDPTAPAQMV